MFTTIDVAFEVKATIRINMDKATNKELGLTPKFFYTKYKF